MTLQAAVETEKGNTVLGAFIDCWANGISSNWLYMWGVPLSVLESKVGSKLQELPKILALKTGDDGIKVRVDVSYFLDLFRGTTSIDDDSSRRSPRKTISTPDLIGLYVEKGHLTHGNASDGEVLHTSRDPFVAFGADRWGDFTSPNGSILFIDKSAIGEFEADDMKRPDIEEVVFNGEVPLTKVAGIYVHENDARTLLERYGGSDAFGKSLQEILHTHNFNSMDEFRKRGVVEVLELALPIKNVLVEPRYRSPEALERLMEAANINEEFVKRVENWPNEVRIACIAYQPMSVSRKEEEIRPLMEVPSLPLPLYGKRKVLRSIDERIKQIHSVVGGVQRRVPEAYEGLDSYVNKTVEALEGAKMAIKNGEAKVKTSPVNSYLNWRTEAIFPERYMTAFDTKQLVSNFACALIKEIDMLEQKYSERAVNYGGGA